MIKWTILKRYGDELCPSRLRLSIEINGRVDAPDVNLEIRITDDNYGSQNEAKSSVLSSAFDEFKRRLGFSMENTVKMIKYEPMISEEDFLPDVTFDGADYPFPPVDHPINEEFDLENYKENV